MPPDMPDQPAPRGGTVLFPRKTLRAEVCFHYIPYTKKRQCIWATFSVNTYHIRLFRIFVWKGIARKQDNRRIHLRSRIDRFFDAIPPTQRHLPHRKQPKSIRQYLPLSWVLSLLSAIMGLLPVYDGVESLARAARHFRMKQGDHPSASKGLLQKKFWCNSPFDIYFWLLKRSKIPFAESVLNLRNFQLQTEFV